MRITNNMLTANFMNNYNNALTRVSDLQQQISSGKAIDRPSDNPVKAVRSLKFYTSLSGNNMFTQNANDAISWMKTSDSAVSGVVTAMTSIRTLVSQSISANPELAYEAIAKQIDGLIDELVTLGNTQVSDRYVFAGQNDRMATQPFTRDSVTGEVTYGGTFNEQSGQSDAGTITMKISPGDPDPQRDKVNIDGVQLFGALDGGDSGHPSIFNDLLDIKNKVQNGTITTDALQTIDDDMDYVISAQTTLGARQSSYQTMLGVLQGDNVTIKSDLSKNEDLDEAQASIDMAAANNVYSAALAVGAKVLPKSLVDYLS
jgi:flagellar hook-associated protein 3 FlgL